MHAHAIHKQLSPILFQALLHQYPHHGLTSRRMVKCGSCVARANMMRSASINLSCTPHAIARPCPPALALSPAPTHTPPKAPLRPHLSEDGEVWLVCGQCQHDEVSIQAVHHMSCVGVPALTAPLLPHKGHGLVLTLTRHVGIRQDHLGGLGGEGGYRGEGGMVRYIVRVASAADALLPLHQVHIAPTH